MRFDKCCRCDKPHENWPAADGGSLCQNCWEAESSRLFWEQVPVMDHAIHAAGEEPTP